MTAQSIFDGIRTAFLDWPDRFTQFIGLGGLRTALGVAIAIGVTIVGLCTGPNLPLVALGLSNFFIAIGVKQPIKEQV